MAAFGMKTTMRAFDVIVQKGSISGIIQAGKRFQRIEPLGAVSKKVSVLESH